MPGGIDEANPVQPALRLVGQRVAHHAKRDRGRQRGLPEAFESTREPQQEIHQEAPLDTRRVGGGDLRLERRLI